MSMARGSSTPKRAVPLEDLPPVKASIEIEHRPPSGDGLMERYSSRIVMRDEAFDYLDAMRASSGDIVMGWTLVGSEVNLLWGKDSYLYRFKVMVDEVLDPLPALRVTYLGPARRHNRRHEWRSNTKLTGKFTMVVDENPEPDGVNEESPTASRQYVTISRNISYSAIRFYSRHRMKPDTRITVEWKLPDGGTFHGTMRIVGTLPDITVYQGAEGRDVVALWDPVLESPALDQWKAFCDSHRYD